MASNNQDLYACEICGLGNLPEEAMRAHTKACHVDDSGGECPFCDLCGVPAAELALHVNQVHLDYLTPENELMAFIDDCRTPGSDALNGAWTASATSAAKEPTSDKTTVKSNQNGYTSIKSNSESSPMRSQLNLTLKKVADRKPDPTSPRSTRVQCPLCPYSITDPCKMEEHINREHFDPTSPLYNKTIQNNGGTSSTSSKFACPLCARAFHAVADLELHVNVEHVDVLSPDADYDLDVDSKCPVCGVALDAYQLTKHVDEHFSGTSPAGTSDCSGGATIFVDDGQRTREQEEFDMLRAQYGMDNQGNFKEQSVMNMQRAVYAGEMTVSDFYQRQVGLRASETSGVDDDSSVTRGLLLRIRVGCNDTIFTCTSVDHYASTYGDRGWGCGYRNAQMLLSALLSNTVYNDMLYKRLWDERDKPASRMLMPSISRLQQLIESAWRQGFDVQGSEQLGCKLYNTRKWIGATEIVTLFSSFRIKCQLVDFHRPTGADGSHPELFQWVLNYFQSTAKNAFVAPLYLQHQGHSRTIVGVEQKRDGTVQLLVFDPSHSPKQMEKFQSLSTMSTALRLIRKGLSAMKARQYQLMAVVGTIDSDMAYEQSKILRALRIPRD